MLPKSIITTLASLVCLGASAFAQSGSVAKVRAQLAQSSTHSAAGRTFSGRLVNPRGQKLEVAGPPALFTGAFVNHGTFKTTETTVTFRGAYTEMGSYVSDPSTNYFTDLLIGTTGTLTGGLGDRFIVSGNFFNGSLQNTTWSTGSAELAFSGGAAHSMSLAGTDAGATFLGYVNNFAWGILRLAPGQSLTLSDGNATAGAALYTQKLILEGGVAQIAAITGNGFSIYYNPDDTANAYLGGLTYPLTGGGAVLPVAAVVKITAITRLASGHTLLQGLGVPSRSHTVQASPDLIVPFAFLANVTAAADGTFQFEDVNAASFMERFYRIIFP